MFCTGPFLQIEFYEGEIILYWVNMVVVRLEKEKYMTNNQASNISITKMSKIKIKRVCWHYM